MEKKSNISTLTLTMISGGEEKVIHPTLVWDEEEAVLIDVGIPGKVEVIQEEMEKLGVPFSKLTRIILTHHDLDHIGSLPEVLEVAEQKIEVLSHELAKPYIEGDKRLIKLTPNLVAPKAKVDRTITDGELLPYCGGIKVIFTPGHTPDHICLYHVETKTLVAADATIAVDGELKGPNPQYTLNMDEAILSLGKLLDYESDQIICYHGGICQGEEMHRIEELVKSHHTKN